MPAKSKAQFRLMKGICEGGIPRNRWPKGMTKAKACEFIRGQSPKGLPARKSAKKKTRPGQYTRRKTRRV